MLRKTRFWTYVGAEAGPFTSVEESLLAKNVRDGSSRTTLYAFYHMAGHFASALGAAECGFLVSQLRVCRTFSVSFLPQRI